MCYKCDCSCRYHGVFYIYLRMRNGESFPLDISVHTLLLDTCTHTVDDLNMCHINYAPKIYFAKGNSYLCVIVGSKFQANFLILCRRPRAYAHIRRAHCQLAISSIALATRNGYSYRSCCMSDRVLHTWLSCVPSDLASNHRQSAGNNSQAGE